MIGPTKRNLLGVGVDEVDYEAAVERVIAAAEAGERYGVSALAVHGIATAVLEEDVRRRVNSLELVTPDGQPVRWALNLLHRSGLSDRVYGPELTLRVCAAASRRGLPIYLYGSSEQVVTLLASKLEGRFAGLEVAGAEPSAFHSLSETERRAVIERIRASGAKLVLVGLGCPRQETFVAENSTDLRMPALAVGAAFDFHAGLANEPPPWMQGAGLQWLHRLAGNPRRLWRRYLLLNPLYVLLVAAQWAGLRRPELRTGEPLPPLARPG
ncbi:MAG: WecB/TagA/CpsF family glycosyltransferase [Solirubrobacterales bacterium]